MPSEPIPIGCNTGGHRHVAVGMGRHPLKRDKPIDFAWRAQFMQFNQWYDCNLPTDYNTREIAEKWANFCNPNESTRVLEVRRTRQVSSALPPQAVIKDGKRLEVKKVYVIKERETDSHASQERIRRWLADYPAGDGWFIIDDGMSSQQLGWSHIIKVSRWIVSDEENE